MKKRMKEKRKNRIASARTRTEQHSSGNDFSVLKLPKGVQTWQPEKEGVYRVDIIPYVVTDAIKKFKNSYAAPGELYYERTYHAHRYIGPDKKSYVCQQMTFGKKCPICDYRRELSSEPDQDEDTKALIRALAPKQRQIFNVVVKGKEEDSKLMIWDVSFYLFGEALDEKMKKADEDEKDAYEQFHDPDGGYTLRIGATEDQIGKNTPKFLRFDDIEFKKREGGLEEDILEQALVLEDILKVVSYDELKKILLQEPDDEDEDEPKAKKKKHPKEDDDEDEMDGEDIDDDDEEDQDEDEDEDTEDEDTDEDDEEDEEEDSDDSDDEDDDNDGDDEDDEDDEDNNSDGDDDGGDGDEDSDDDNDSDDEDEDPGVAKGDLVKWKYKGNTRKGRVVKVVDGPKGTVARIKVKGQDQLSGVAVDDLTVIKKAEVEDEDEDEAPPKKKKKPKPAADDDDDDLPFGIEDEDEQDEHPKKKKKGK